MAQTGARRPTVAIKTRAAPSMLRW